MAIGTVKWFDEQRGYGFIKPDEGGEDLFVHRSGVLHAELSSLREGARVEYEVVQGRRGPQASDVRLAR